MCVDITQPSSDNLSLLQNQSFKVSLESGWRKQEFPDAHYNNLRKTIIELLDAEEYPQSFSSGAGGSGKPLGIPNSMSSVNISKQSAVPIHQSSSSMAGLSLQAQANQDQAYKQPSGIMFPLIMPPELESLVSDLDTNFNSS